MQTKMLGRMEREIPYAETTLEEAVFKLEEHLGEGWFDGDKQAVVLVE